MVRKKALDFVFGLLLFGVFLIGFIGPIGGYEAGNVTGIQCIVRSGLSLVICIGIVSLNTMLMEAAK